MHIQDYFLYLPVSHDAEKTLIKWYVGQDLVRYQRVQLGTWDKHDMVASIDMSSWVDQTLRCECEIELSPRFGAEAQGPQDEAHPRPQFHFTAPVGWLNDPNGLVHYKGQWHMFYQHNPSGVQWENMTWGWASSTDLCHWDHHGDLLWGDTQGTMYSGGAVVDWNNTSGLQSGEHPPIILFYTAASHHCPDEDVRPDGFVQCIAVSTDGGKSFSKYNANPIVDVIAPATRDPKVIWHEEKQHWVMVLFEKHDANHKHNNLGYYQILTSKNLLSWTCTDRLALPGTCECPDLYPLTLEGTDDEYWVFWGADGYYLLGEFDGETFRAVDVPRLAYNGGSKNRTCNYAAQTYSDAPGGARVHVAWLKHDVASTQYNQQMSIPTEVSLKPFNRPTLCFTPAVPFQGSWQDMQPMEAADALPAGPSHVRLTVESNDSQYEATWRHGDTTITVNLKENTLTVNEAIGVLEPSGDGPMYIDIYLDYQAVEVFANRGQCYMSLQQTLALKGGAVETSGVIREQAVSQLTDQSTLSSTSTVEPALMATR